MPDYLYPVFWVFIFAVIVQCGYALYFFMRILPRNETPNLSGSETRPVSIIICARNEAQALRKNLPQVLYQKYGGQYGDRLFEVIVVDDSSSDETPLVLAEFGKQNAHLKVITITPSEKAEHVGKKFALNQAVTASKHEWLLFTDADCCPASDEWLSMMAAPLASGKEIALGYGGYYARAGFLNKFIRWETMHTFLQYSTYAMAGKPYMGVGRNLACTKDAWLRATETKAWKTLASGDDDLMVSAIGTKNNTAVVFDPASFTYSEAKVTWGDWRKQKQRHLSTGKYYKWDIKMLLGIYALSHAVLWLCAIVLLFSPHFETVLLIIASRCIIYWLLWVATAQKLKEKNMVYLFPVFDIAWMMYNFAFLPYIAWKNKQQWK